jgi:hypothetical protein
VQVPPNGVAINEGLQQHPRQHPNASRLYGQGSRAATTPSTKQPYLAVGGPNFVVKGNIQMRIFPKQDVEHLKEPICAGVAYSTGQPTKACRITGVEAEHNLAGEEELNFAFDLTILDSDYNTVARKIDYYVKDDIINVVRWECQHAQISQEAIDGTLNVNVVQYSCRNQGRSEGGFIGLQGELVVDIGDTAEDIVGDFDNDTDDGDPVWKRYAMLCFTDALMNATNNVLDGSKVKAVISKASGNNINFTFEYMNLEAQISSDVSAIANMNKDAFDLAVVDLVNQLMSPEHHITAAAIRSGVVRKIRSDAARVVAAQEDVGPPPCHDHGAGSGEEEQVCSTFMIDSNAAEYFQNDQRFQVAMRQAFANYTCGDAEEMTMSVVLTELPSTMPDSDEVNPETLAERTSSSDAKSKARLRRTGPEGVDDHEVITPLTQTAQEMKVSVCVYEHKDYMRRVHFMMKHVPFSGISNNIIGLVKEIGIFQPQEVVTLAIKSQNITDPVTYPPDTHA